MALPILNKRGTQRENRILDDIPELVGQLDNFPLVGTLVALLGPVDSLDPDTVYAAGIDGVHDLFKPPLYIHKVLTAQLARNTIIRKVLEGLRQVVLGIKQEVGDG